MRLQASWSMKTLILSKFFGKTESWLTPGSGRASLNLLKMAREGLAFELRNLLYLAKKNRVAAKKDAILFNVKDREEICKY